MADSITQAPAAGVVKPPLAMGPIPKPMMRKACLNTIKRWWGPIAGITMLSSTAVYFLLYERHRKAYDNYIKNLDPDKLFHEIKEYGGFKGAKASWQQE